MTVGLAALHAGLDAVRRERLKPPPVLTLSQWADAHRYLSREASAEPGKWRTDRAPYLREIMDAVTDPLVEEVVVMSASQVGKSEILLNAIGYYADQDPAPILMIQPSLDVGQGFSKDRIAPMVRDTPRLRNRFADAKSRSSDTTIMHKVYPGGHITIVGANSPAGLAMRPIRILLADEVDRYPPSAGAEGDPLALATKRTDTFWNRKIVRTSTPTLKNVSHIEHDYAQSSQGSFYVQCVVCHEPQVLEWANVKWTENRADTAYMACSHCGAIWEERDKLALLRSGRWVHLFPERKVRGFHLNALYSPWARWTDRVKEWLKAQGKPELLKAFVNTVLAQVWEEDAERADPESLMARREEYLTEQAPAVPAYVGLLTLAGDVQADRVELLVRGWGDGEESALIHLETIRGDPSRPEVWQDVDRVLDRKWDGLGIACACIDSGYLPDSVYQLARRRRRVFPTKGNSTPGQPILGRLSKRPNERGVRILPVGTEAAKDLLYMRFKIQHPGAGYYHFPKWADAEYFAQLTAEYSVRKYKHGRPYTVYEKDPNRRNEALDLEVLAYVALLTLGSSTIKGLGALAAKRTPQAAKPEPPQPTPAQQAIQRILKGPPKRGWARDF